MTGKICNITVFGSSVPLTVRPRRTEREQGTYTDVLSCMLAESGRIPAVRSFAGRSRLITHENPIEFTGNVQRTNPELVVIHYGINEAAPRFLPYGLWMAIHGPRYSVSRPMAYFLAAMQRIETYALKVFRCGGWVSPGQFGRMLGALIDVCRNETLSAVAVVNIGPANDHFRRCLPGIDRRIAEYNEIIESVAQAKGAVVIDIMKMAEIHGRDRIMVDGAHLTVEGHRLVADKLYAIVNPD